MGHWFDRKSRHPLSIILVGIGDGPWDGMQKFDDKILAREFDNFQFVNFTAIMSKNTSSSEKETAFALAALIEIPVQYKAARKFGLLGRVTGKAKKVVPKPPPVPFSHPTGIPSGDSSYTATSTRDDLNQTYRECSPRLSECPICRQHITSRIRLALHVAIMLVSLWRRRIAPDVLELVGIPKRSQETSAGGNHVEFVSWDQIEDQVGKLKGGIEFLELCGFEKIEGGEYLYLAKEKVDMVVLQSAGTELNNGINNPFFRVL